MKWHKPDIRLLSLIPVITLGLGGCVQHASRVGSEVSLTDYDESGLSASDKKRPLNAGRWLGMKNPELNHSATENLTRHDNLWERLFDLYDLPPIEHEDIDKELEWFVNHPTYIDRVQTRAKPFLYSIVRQLEKHEVPGEIALLPIIESAFQPHAVSPANAAGIWQFIPATGRRYGLRQNRSYDGRRDVYASTRAAIKYLKKLHHEFNGDWLLALAAYNCGEGAVERAIQKNLAQNRPTDFWSLDLPGETRSYVPRLLAVAKLFEGANQYGIDLHHIPNEALFKPVKVNTQINLALAADVADISLDKLQELNPGFKQRIADADGSYHLFIPADKTDEFKSALYRLAQESQGNSPEARRAENEGNESDRASSRARQDKLQPGKVTRVAMKTDDKPQATEVNRLGAAGHDSRSDDNSGKRIHYVIQPGDTLWSIAKKHSIDVEQISKWNALSVKKGIKDGQKLVLWDKDAGKKLTLTASGIRASQSINYKIKEGDSLFSISRRFGVSVADLRKLNGSELNKLIQPGKSITVPKLKN
ncbi:MAG: transglycosylase SLT domain-containing protein [Methylococcaceae bacterium]